MKLLIMIFIFCVAYVIAEYFGSKKQKDGIITIISLIYWELLKDFEVLNPNDLPLCWAIKLARNDDTCRYAALIKLKNDVGLLKGGVIGEITNEAVYKYITIKDKKSLEDGGYMIALIQSKFGDWKNENN